MASTMIAPTTRATPANSKPRIALRIDKVVPDHPDHQGQPHADGKRDPIPATEIAPTTRNVGEVINHPPAKPQRRLMALRASDRRERSPSDPMCRRSAQPARRPDHCRSSSRSRGVQSASPWRSSARWPRIPSRAWSKSSAANASPYECGRVMAISFCCRGFRFLQLRKVGENSITSHNRPLGCVTHQRMLIITRFCIRREQGASAPE